MSVRRYKPCVCEANLIVAADFAFAQRTLAATRCRSTKNRARGLRARMVPLQAHVPSVSSQSINCVSQRRRFCVLSPRHNGRD